MGSTGVAPWSVLELTHQWAALQWGGVWYLWSACCCREHWQLASGDVVISAARRRVDNTHLHSVIHRLWFVTCSHCLCLSSSDISFPFSGLYWKQKAEILSYKRQFATEALEFFRLSHYNNITLFCCLRCVFMPPVNLLVMALLSDNTLGHGTELL